MAHTHDCQKCGKPLFHLDDFCKSWVGWTCVDCVRKDFPSRKEQAQPEIKDKTNES